MIVTSQSQVQNKTVEKSVIVCIRDWSVIEKYDISVVEGVRLGDVSGLDHGWNWVDFDENYVFQETGEFEILKGNLATFEAIEYNITRNTKKKCDAMHFLLFLDNRIPTQKLFI